MSETNYIYMIRRQRSKISHDVERFWPYKTEQEAQQVAAKLDGYKVSVEKHYSPLTFDEWIKTNNTRFPKL